MVAFNGGVFSYIKKVADEFNYDIQWPFINICDHKTKSKRQKISGHECFLLVFYSIYSLLFVISFVQVVVAWY